MRWPSQQASDARRFGYRHAQIQAGQRQGLATAASGFGQGCSAKVETY